MPVRPSVRLSVCLSVPLSVTRVDQSKTVHDRITQPSPQCSPMTSFLMRNGTLKFQREDRERGCRIREGYEKNVLSATAGIVFPFTRRRCYRALTLALAGPSCEYWHSIQFSLFQNEKIHHLHSTNDDDSD